MASLCATCPHLQHCPVPQMLQKVDTPLEELDDCTREAASEGHFPYADGVKFRIEVESCVHHPDDDGTYLEDLWDDLCDQLGSPHDDYFERASGDTRLIAFHAGLRDRLVAGEGMQSITTALERLLEYITTTPPIPTVDELCRHWGPWGEHPDHPLESWHEEAESDNTRLGYWEWVISRMEMGVTNEEDTNLEERR